MINIKSQGSYSKYSLGLLPYIEAHTHTHTHKLHFIPFAKACVVLFFVAFLRSFPIPFLFRYSFFIYIILRFARISMENGTESINNKRQTKNIWPKNRCEGALTYGPCALQIFFICARNMMTQRAHSFARSLDGPIVIHCVFLRLLTTLCHSMTVIVLV